MPFPIQIKLLQHKPPDIVVRDWRKITRQTYTVMGEHWHSQILPDHFKPNAKFVYNYRLRSTKYLKHKKWAARRGRVGNRTISPEAATTALTYTGRLKNAMLSVSRIRAFPTRFTVRMPGTTYTPSKQRSTKQPFLQGELTKLLKREVDELRKIGKQAATEALNQTRQARQQQFG